IKEGAFSYTRNFTIEDLDGFCRNCKHAKVCKGGCTSIKVASGNGKENRMCVYRVLTEGQHSRLNISHIAAAVALSSLLSTGLAGCDQVDDPDPGPKDTATETDTAAGESDSGITGSDSETDTADSETETEYDTELSTDYGMPYDTDFNVPIYDMVPPEDSK
ncbi:MAG: hypothetical protein JXR91_12535, partial [Deltaproteobacteria bacterium]|nr:hypothetical protein [Deltaproteobacteria bacterium]